MATGGVFNVTFDRENPYQLLRICLPDATALYPEISGSHYRCSLRFLRVARPRAAPDADRSGRPLHADLLPLSARPGAGTSASVAPVIANRMSHPPHCPTCGRPIEWSEAFPFRPFCTERCRLIDLGAWLSEERRIPGEPAGTAPGDETATGIGGGGLESAEPPSDWTHRDD